jgi:hypothetical protein
VESGAWREKRAAEERIKKTASSRKLEGARAELGLRTSHTSMDEH